MKINDSSGSAASQLNRTQELNANTASSQTRGAGSSRGDQVSLSNLSSALSAKQSESPQHAAKLAQLSASVASGSYQVDSQALSSKIISASTRS
jgi:flagellar biosynthesis anti-sigma factor FlgM